MNSSLVAVEELAGIEHDEAMRLADVEYGRMLDLVDQLGPDDWSRPTDCPDWDVRAMLGHLLGMLDRNADRAEAARQLKAAAEIAQQRGCLRIDALTGLQVQKHAHLSVAELVQALHTAVPLSLAGRRDSSIEERAVSYPAGLPGEGSWTIGYLLDIIQTRDPWIHRVDIIRATGHELVLTADHDGRLVADAVREWGSRHGQPFSLILDGPAGGAFAGGGCGPELRLDAVEFCRIVSGRARGEGLLATHVPF